MTIPITLLAGGKHPPHHAFRMTEETERNREGRQAAFPDGGQADIKPLHRAAAAMKGRMRADQAWPDQGRTNQAALPTYFDRGELSRILALYGRMVAAGEWRDYALDFLPDAAVFSIFRRTSEMALFRVEKHPRLRGRQGQYSVIAHGGLVLKRGHDLAQVLKVFDRKLLKALKA